MKKVARTVKTNPPYRSQAVIDSFVAKALGAARPSGLICAPTVGWWGKEPAPLGPGVHRVPHCPPTT